MDVVFEPKPVQVVTVTMALDAVLLEYLQEQHLLYGGGVPFGDYLADVTATVLREAYDEDAYTAR